MVPVLVLLLLLRALLLPVIASGSSGHDEDVQESRNLHEDTECFWQTCIDIMADKLMTAVLDPSVESGALREQYVLSEPLT